MQYYVIPETAISYCRGDEEMRRCVGNLAFCVESHSEYYGSKWDGTSELRIHTMIEVSGEKFMFDLSTAFVRSFVKYVETVEPKNKYTFVIDSDADKLKAIKEILEIKCTH